MLSIGKLSTATGVKVPTIRYYEEIGLLPAPRRAGTQRRYDDDDVRRLTFVRRCRDFGFPIDQVRTLATLTEDNQRSCQEARDLAQAHLAAVRAKLRELRALERNITDVIAVADATCPGGSAPDCVVLDELATPNG